MSARSFRFPFPLPGLLWAALWFPVLPEAYVPKPRPAFAVPAEFSPDAVPQAGQGGYGIYWLLMDNQEDIAGHSHYFHYVRKVVSEAGLESVSRISVDFAPSYETVDFHHITVWRKGAAREILPDIQPAILRREQDWEMLGMLDGRKTMLFTLEDIRVGDIVAYDFTLRGDNPIFKGRASGSGYLRFGFPVERVHLRLVHPPEARIFIAGINGAASGRVESSGKNWARVWDSTRLAPLLYESDAPSWLEVYPRVQWSEYETWKDVVDWAVEMYPFASPISPALAAWIDIHNTLEPRERVRAALRLVQDSVRYLGLEIGESSHKPADPSVVYARRFGDCKDKVFLLCALLRHMGMEAYPALVNTDMRDKVAEYQPSPKAFNHVIAKVPFEGRTYWFDATLQGRKGDPFKIQNIAFGKALVVDRGNFDFEDIELGPESEGNVDITQSFKVARWDSTASLVVTSVYTGAEAEAVRADFRDRNREEMQNNYRDYYAGNYPGIRVDRPMEFQDDSAGERVTLTEFYAVDSLCQPAEGTGRTACSLYPVDVSALVPRPNRKIRTADYALAYPKKVREEITLRTPEPISLTTENRRIEHDDFEFSWNESSRGGFTRMEYSYTALSDHVPVSRFKSYLDDINIINDNLGATIYPEPGFLDDPNYLMIFFSIGCMAAGGWAARRLLRLRIPSRPSLLFEPQPLGGALLLLGLGLLIRPFQYLYAGYQMLAFLDQGKWNALTIKGSSQYHPLWAPVLLADTAGIIVSIILGFAMWPLFFRRQASFPKAFLAVYSVAVVLQILDVAGLLLIPGTSENGSSPDSPASLAWSVIIGAGWMAYLFRSVRAQETFVFPLAEAHPDGELPEIVPT